MAAATEYSEEQLKYFRICCVATDALAEGLRTIFKQEWDNRYKASLGEWKDEPRNGLDFYNGESSRNQRRNAQLLAIMINGDRAEWDCTMLFYAIRYSDCIGTSLNTVARRNIDGLRKFRNEQFAHMPRGHLSDVEFQNAIGIVDGAFKKLGLSRLKIQEIRNQTSFPTEELRKVLGEVDNLKRELQEKEGKLQESEKQQQVLHDQLLNEVSPFCILPSKPSHDVACRDNDVARITQQLKELKEANKSRLSYLYISGNPGSGKSQLAGLIAKRFFEELNEIPSSIAFVMTLNAESLDTLLESYVSYARNLKCPDYSVTNIRDSKDLKTEEKIANLKTLIITKVDLYTSWLLVVDNVTSMSLVHPHLPEPGNEKWSRGQMLITTQDAASIPSTNSFTNHNSVSKGMEADDACSLLAMLSGFTGSEMQKEVAQALDYQPLALASAAIYVKEVRQSKSNFGWNGYMEKLQKGQRAITETILSETNPSYQKSMTAAIILAAEKMMSSDNVLKHTFSLISLCAQQPLSLKIVINYILETDEEFKDENVVRMRIQRSSLLLLDEDDSEIYIRVHQVVRDVINTATQCSSKNQRLEVLDGAIKSFSEFIDDNLPKNLNDSDSLVSSRHLVPHLKSLAIEIENVFSQHDISQIIKKLKLDIEYYLHYFVKASRVCLGHSEFISAQKYGNRALDVIRYDKFCDGEVPEVSSLIGVIHHKLGNFHQAKEYLERALAIRLQKLGPHHVDVARFYHNLATVLSDLGDLKQAKEYHERALAIQLQKLGPHHVDVASSYNNLATVLSDLGDLKQAKEYHERALAIRLQKLGPDHVDVASSYQNLASVLHRLGDLKQAKEYHERTLAFLLQKLGPDHVDVARSYSNLANVLSDLGDLKQAKEYHERALAIRLQKLGPHHVDVAGSYNNLATVLSDPGDVKQAKEYYERALAIQLQKLGPDHVDVASSYDNLAMVLRDLGDLKQAKEYHERALAIRLQKLGPHHVDVATSYNNLANVLSDLGDLKQAKEYHERALAIRLQKLGTHHVDVASSYNNLALLLHDLGDLKQAKEYHERALAIRLQKLGPDHVDVASSYDNLATVLSDLGDLKQAKEYHERALAIRLQKLGPHHVDVASSYNNLATVLSDLGDLKQAKEYHERALAIRLQKLGPDHVDVASSYNNLANVLSDLGDLKQVKEYHERALAIQLQKLGPHHVDVATSYNNLATVLGDLGDLKQAKENFERALNLLETLAPEHPLISTVQRNLALLNRYTRKRKLV